MVWGSRRDKEFCLRVTEEGHRRWTLKHEGFSR